MGPNSAFLAIKNAITLKACMKIERAVGWWPPIELDISLKLEPDNPHCVRIEGGKVKDPNSILPQYNPEPPEVPPQGTCWWYVSRSEWANTNYNCFHRQPKRRMNPCDEDYNARFTDGYMKSDDKSYDDCNSDPQRVAFRSHRGCFMLLVPPAKGESTSHSDMMTLLLSGVSGKCYLKVDWTKFKHISYIDKFGDRHTFPLHELYDPTLRVVEGRVARPATNA